MDPDEEPDGVILPESFFERLWDETDPIWNLPPPEPPRHERLRREEAQHFRA